MSQTHRARPGECFATIAERYGFDRYQRIYHHSSNEALRARRPNPNVLEPGDLVAIPPREDGRRSLAVDANHRVVVKRPEKELRLRLLDERHEPLDGAGYLLVLPGHEAREGVTGGDGLLRQPVPLGVTSAVLTVAGTTRRLRLGWLRPVRDAEADGAVGVCQRLENLGYRTSGALDARTGASIALFRHDEGLPLSDALDDALRDALVARYGG